MRSRMCLWIGILAAALACSKASAQQDPPQWSNATAYAGGGLVRASNGNFYRCMKSNTNHDPTRDSHIYWELYYVRTNLNLTVAKSGATFTSVQNAWSMLQGATIANAATVTISINSMGGTYKEALNTLSLNHPFGSQIFLQGDVQANVILSFPDEIFGLTLSGGHSFGGITKVTLDGTGSVDDTSTGVYLVHNATLGPSTFTIHNFQTAVEVDDHSAANVTGANFGYFDLTALNATNGSFVNANSVVINPNTANGTGINAVYGATVDCQKAIITHPIYGIVAGTNATVNASSTILTYCDTGFTASSWGTIDATKSTCQYSASIAYTASTGGHILTYQNTVGNNAQNYSPPVNTSAPDQGYIVH